MSSIIPLEVVDDEEFQALDAAITAAELSVSSSTKAETSTLRICPPSLNPCYLQANAVPLGLRSDLSDLSTSQAPNKLEFLTDSLNVENRVPCSTSLHGSGERNSSSALEFIAADGAECLPSELLCVRPIHRECGSCGGISDASTEETFISSTKSSEMIQTDSARVDQANAGQGCSGSNGVVLHAGHTEELRTCSTCNASVDKNVLKSCNSSRHLPSWPRPSSGHWRKSSRPSEHEESRQTIRPRVDNALASTLDLPDVSCTDTYRLPWGIVPHSFKGRPKNKLPSFQFKGQIIYSDTVLDAESAAKELLRQVEAKKPANGGLVLLGFDTEWKVVFKRGAERRKVAVVQLCVDADKCNVFHVIHSGIPSSLKTILEDPMVSKVGIGAYGDAGKLRSDYNVNVKGVKELSGLANLKMVGCMNKSWGLSSLAEELLGKQVDKAPSIRMGDWEVEKLSEAQLLYAATDAFASLYLFQVLATFPDPCRDGSPKTHSLEPGNMK